MSAEFIDMYISRDFFDGLREMFDNPESRVFQHESDGNYYRASWGLELQRFENGVWVDHDMKLNDFTTRRHWEKWRLVEQQNSEVAA